MEPRLIFQHPYWPKFHWQEKAVSEALDLFLAEEKLLLNKLNYIDSLFLDELYRISIYDELTSSLYLDDEFIAEDEFKTILSHKTLVYEPELLKTNFSQLPKTYLFDNYVDTHIELLLDIQTNTQGLLSKTRLLNWSRALSSRGLGLLWRNAAHGSDLYRPGPYPYAQEKLPTVEFSRLDSEIDKFLGWFNGPFVDDPAIKAAISHLWILLIQPIVTNNGRLARLIATGVLADRLSISKYYSASKEINRHRYDYFKVFAKTLTGSLDITPWLLWYLKILLMACQAANGQFDLIINQSVYWAKTKTYPLNRRQKNVLALLLADFIGLLTPERYAEITKCNNLTAEIEFNQLIFYNLIESKFLAPTKPGPKPRQKDWGFF
jgi:Fic family protein